MYNHHIILSDFCIGMIQRRIEDCKRLNSSHVSLPTEVLEAIMQENTAMKAQLAEDTELVRNATEALDVPE